MPNEKKHFYTFSGIAMALATLVLLTRGLHLAYNAQGVVRVALLLTGYFFLGMAISTKLSENSAAANLFWQST